MSKEWIKASLKDAVRNNQIDRKTADIIMEGLNQGNSKRVRRILSLSKFKRAGKNVDLESFSFYELIEETPGKIKAFITSID